jgi:ferredoxin
MKLKMRMVLCPRYIHGRTQYNGFAQKQRRRRIMAYKISEDCTMCGACESSCPVEAISPGDGIYVIDAETCTDCGACESTCPVGAISAG